MASLGHDELKYDTCSAFVTVYCMQYCVFFYQVIMRPMSTNHRVLTSSQHHHLHDKGSVKNRKNIYGLDEQVTFELYGHFKCYKSCILNKTTFTKCCLTQWISKLPGSFEIHWIRQYLLPDKFHGSDGHIKTKPIFTGLWHGKLLWFFTL